MVSLTRMDSDLRWIEPLKMPASVGLYLTVMKVSYLGFILRCLGSTTSRVP
jgi:hypothetical protein